jgi:transcriptional antiterminator RfaH
MDEGHHRGSIHLSMSGPRWYVIHTRPRQEDRADRNLRAWNVPTLSPKLRCRHARPHGAVIERIEPLFPQYIFAQFIESELLHKVRFTRGVRAVVEFGGGPVPVDDEVMALLRSRIGEDGFVAAGREFRRGDPVVIEGGPLRDLIGVFECDVNASHRVKILLTTVSCRAHLEIDRDLLTRIV